MNTLNRRFRQFYLRLVAVFFVALSLPAATRDATGDFTVYCDGAGLFLSNVAGAPANRLVLFSRMNSPPGTMGNHYIGQGKWSYVSVLPKGCLPKGNCEGLGQGKVWIDDWNTEGTFNPVPERISGKYEVDLDAKHLAGRFVAKLNGRKYGSRLCE